jgi:hypothetical protein
VFNEWSWYKISWLLIRILCFWFMTQNTGSCLDYFCFTIRINICTIVVTTWFDDEFVIWREKKFGNKKSGSMSNYYFGSGSEFYIRMYTRKYILWKESLIILPVLLSVWVSCRAWAMRPLYQFTRPFITFSASSWDLLATVTKGQLLQELPLLS